MNKPEKPLKPAEINKQIFDLETQKHSELNKYKATIFTIDEKIKEIQKECPHIRIEQHPGPSGGSDSSYECVICGKEADRKSGLTK